VDGARRESFDGKRMRVEHGIAHCAIVSQHGDDHFGSANGGAHSATRAPTLAMGSVFSRVRL
jgi:hypothetical protein